MDRNDILNHKPFIIGKDNFELHIITCHSYLLMTLWCLKSFYDNSGLSPNLIIHDDGTLTNDDIRIFNNMFSDCKIISKELADERINPILQNYPYLKQFRNKNHYYPKQLIDVNYFAEKDYLIYMDVDFIWYRSSKHIKQFYENQNPFFFGGGYGFDKNFSRSNFYFRRQFGFSLQNLNGGIYGRTKENFFDIDYLESIAKIIVEAEDFIETKIGKIKTLTDGRNEFDWVSLTETLLNFLMIKNSNTKILWAGFINEVTPEYCKDIVYNYIFYSEWKILKSKCAFCHFCKNDKIINVKEKFFTDGVSLLNKRSL